jgi:hypothetical protein
MVPDVLIKVLKGGDSSFCQCKKRIVISVVAESAADFEA